MGSKRNRVILIYTLILAALQLHLDTTGLRLAGRYKFPVALWQILNKVNAGIANFCDGYFGGLSSSALQSTA